MNYESPKRIEPNNSAKLPFADALAAPDFDSVLNFDLRPTDAQSLVESLKPGEFTPAQLCDAATQLLDKVGETTTVNGVPSTVTRKYRKVDQAHGSFYARLGRSDDVTESHTLPAFVLTTTPDFDEIETPNGKFSEFFFSSNDYGVQLMNGPDAPTPNGYLSNRPGHLKLAAEIIQSLKREYRNDPEAHSTVQQANYSATNKEIDSLANSSYDTSPSVFSEIKHSLKAPLIAAGAAGAILLPVTIVLESGNGDVTKASHSGPGKVGVHPERAQLCNTDGVCVDGPGVSLKSIPLAPLAVVNRIPANTAYAKAMEKLSVPGGETLNPSHIEQTEQGIYAYSYPTHTVQTPDGNCTYVEGNFNQGISTIYTTSTSLGRLVSIKVLDTSTLELCKAVNAPRSAAGSIYIARGTS